MELPVTEMGETAGNLVLGIRNCKLGFRQVVFLLYVQAKTLSKQANV